ncbi:c-type cytochrome [Bradyrhizobium sp.]|uniref:c-type cytochrome n=1 Tax=Bradyrhizobium sp. TaxID=376 RepID=UPI002D6292DF|nr:c-type cytochrome [Bradyrhizobium sp.]HZR73986.1 c-type cytochrome [Bradyrhizobium sp.]
MSVVVAIVALAGSLYAAFVPGLSVAHQEPPTAEVAIATWLLHQSVPDEAKDALNPLKDDAANIAAGRELYRDKCETCHAYDGGGKTTIGSGQYPRPPALRSFAIQATSDGELFYHIRNGIRNTGMPAWNLPDRQIWQLVSYIRHLPQVASLIPAANAAEASPPDHGHYVGSKACKGCHEEVYARWIKTRMANVVRDPREHPDAITPDISQPNPVYNFTIDDVSLVYGSRWKQRYFKKVGDDYFPLPVQWDVAHKMWRKYFVPNGADWWAVLYPPDNFQRPTGPLCDGCHSVNYDIKAKTVTEWNVGCERCHGPGEAHVKKPVRETIENPGRFDYVHASDTCIQCHSQGQPKGNPIEGKYYDWPVGYDVTKNLKDYWNLEEHKLGETNFMHFADGTAHKNRMQGNDFIQSLMYARGVTCFSCHDPHGTDNVAMVRKSGNALCLDCHGPNTQAGPHAPSVEAHTHHKAGSPGNECIACHMPKIEETISDQKVRSHTFHFVTPGETETLKIPNACNECHTDKSIEWAKTALESWPDRSPWRMSK